MLLTETLQKCFNIDKISAAWQNIRYFLEDFMENRQVPRGMA